MASFQYCFNSNLKHYIITITTKIKIQVKKLLFPKKHFNGIFMKLVHLSEVKKVLSQMDLVNKYALYNLYIISGPILTICQFFYLHYLLLLVIFYYTFNNTLNAFFINHYIVISVFEIFLRKYLCGSPTNISKHLYHWTTLSSDLKTRT